MFQSMNTIILTITILVIILSSIFLRAKNPYKLAIQSFSALFSNKKMFIQFLALFLILYLNKMEQLLEKHIRVGDFTPIVHQFEGNIVYYIQHFFMNDVLTSTLTFFYIIVFPVLMVTSFVIYVNEDHQLFYSIVYGLMLNYLIAIPFYLFLPIYEVWYFDHHVQFLIPHAFPNFDLVYRPLSGIDNNFPSLHTSISVTIALIASHSKNTLFRGFIFFSTVIIVFSTFYLGIHWVLDMIAGVILAFIASQTGLRLSEMVLVTNHYELGNTPLSSKR